MRVNLTRNLFIALVVVLAAAGPASADNFLVVYDGSTADCDALEASLTTLGHTFTRLTTASALALTANDVVTTYNATFWLGMAASDATETTWCTNLMDAGGNLLIADNDYGYYGNAMAVYTTYFEATYLTDAGSDGQLTGQGIMAGINPDISADPYPDNFSISGVHGTVIFDAPVTGAAGTAIERTVGMNTYRAVHLAWDYQYTPTADRDPIATALVTYLTEPIVPVELQSFSIE